MKRIHVYEYDRRNREQFVNAINGQGGHIISWALFTQPNEKLVFPVGTNYVYIDASSLFANEDKAGASCIYLEKIITIMLRQTQYKMYLILERQYSLTLRNLMYYRVSEVSSLEKLLGLNNCFSRNIVDITQTQFANTVRYVNENLFGNPIFKNSLAQELEKFRVFNIAGYQPIFSILLCGSTGIGKTELARLLHRALSGNEPLIKINFGNYSSDNALNSLIGSPRGYVGSNKGELSEKLASSRGTVILIDEFEKASKQVFNFFLQLLEDGSFTDSQGRDYDLNKYIIIFTSNIQYEKIADILSPELRSRFSLIYHMQNLSNDEKQLYVAYKTQKLAQSLQTHRNIVLTPEILAKLQDVDVKLFQDMRSLNAEIMKRTAKIVYPLLYADK